MVLLITGVLNIEPVFNKIPPDEAVYHRTCSVASALKVALEEEHTNVSVTRGAVGIGLMIAITCCLTLAQPLLIASA